MAAAVLYRSVPWIRWTLPPTAYEPSWCPTAVADRRRAAQHDDVVGLEPGELGGRWRPRSASRWVSRSGPPPFAAAGAPASASGKSAPVATKATATPGANVFSDAFAAVAYRSFPR